MAPEMPATAAPNTILFKEKNLRIFCMVNLY